MFSATNVGRANKQSDSSCKIEAIRREFENFSALQRLHKPKLPLTFFIKPAGFQIEKIFKAYQEFRADCDMSINDFELFSI